MAVPPGRGDRSAGLKQEYARSQMAAGVSRRELPSGDQAMYLLATHPVRPFIWPFMT